MNSTTVLRSAIFSVCSLFGIQAIACETQPNQPAIYKNPDCSFEARADDLLARMTLEEKISQMMNAAPAIPRLQIPAYEWWNEALHGVARAGAATVFPQAIGLAASFDTHLMGDVASVISDEARAKHHDFISRDSRLRYQGLTFWSPNVNIFRDPRWGRGQETYGEDPFLTAAMGVEFVKGLQQTDGKYRKLDATAKHFAVHSGPEANRHEFNAKPSERDLYETYLPAFRALVQDANVKSVMGAYNRVNGESASASQRLLQDILRKDWGFKGYVVSDCDSVEDIYLFHKIVPTAAEAAALAVKTGDDLNCGKTYAALKEAVDKKLITEQEIDVSLKRLLLTRFELGMFDDAKKVIWARIPYSVNQDSSHDQLARRAAQKSIVLLKNNGILPLSSKQKNIAVIGPTSDEIMSLLGNYYGTPAAPVTILQGVRAAAPAGTQVNYARGVDLVEGRDDPRAAPIIEPSYLRPDANSKEQGLKGEYFRGRDFAGKPIFTRIDSRISFRWDRGSPTDDAVARGEIKTADAVPADNFSVRWTGQLTAPTSGAYEISVAANDGMRLYINGALVIDSWDLSARLQSKSAKIDLQAGKSYAIKLEYFEDIRDAEVRLSWRLPNSKPGVEEALDLAKAADVIVFVGGLTGDVEGEEMTVNYPGFAGGDRTDIHLPQVQQRLLESLKATGKPVVVVLTTGSALAVDWAKKNADAILVAWYSGQRGGNAVADVLWGTENPAGRLPITFYKGDEKLPAFDDYSMHNRTYRYFTGEALYPFGHGLSYSEFKYSNLKLNKKAVRKQDEIQVAVDITNTSNRDGDEVVQLYAQPVAVKKEQAIKNLRGFVRVHLKAGETQTVHFTLKPNKALIRYDLASKQYVVDKGKYQLQVGASSSDVRLHDVISVK
ncbi:glucan 1,4-alpha-glucosidase [Cellvibrio zantedeschiae]|uniref:Glucan 1,4-alpha-glucosidase n=1 Tax=Cellvibrio zantedeschiae TaxID=1237077 RepID=A0ABQ3BBK8_9GAMM|nr:glycoside hydrolase family 3 protein [Cellvibrio zantedeschiae]GGY86601.1 glucan 1,4-alpha-glucosidase [Cellvibrio zantedeschiae]